MNIQIEISDKEVSTIISILKQEGVEVSTLDVQTALEDYLHGQVEDFEESRIDDVVEMLMD